MAEFIGSTISLISKRDIRYVGILEEISSENATVTLRDVRSFGTEGRKQGSEEKPPSADVWEHIVFKGSDVKDLSIEEGPTIPEPPPPQAPNDPAILESTRKTTPSGNAPQPTHSAGPQDPQNRQPGRGPPFPPQGPNQRPPFPQMPYSPYGYHPHDQRFGPQGFPSIPPGPPGPGYPHMPYGAPPPWYGPNGLNRFGGMPPVLPPGQFPQQQMPIGPPGQVKAPNQQAPLGAPKGPSADRKSAGSAQPPSSTPNPPPGFKGPVPPNDTKPGVDAALAPPASVQDQLDGQASSPALKSGKIVPAVPLPSAARIAANANGQAKAATLAAQGAAAGTAQAIAAKLGHGATQQSQLPTAPKKSLEDANRDAKAAVAQAMAKLSAGKKGADSVDTLVQQVQNLQASNGNGAPGGRRTSQSRGGRGNRHREPARKVEVPKDDFDFESSNAKFNKQDLVKEAIATGSPLSSPVDGNGPSELNVSASSAPMTYNKASSFFDNISSEIKERAEGLTEQMGGREFRNEERKKNLETFGQGSVDSGYRHRGRGRGRGFRGRGRGRGGGNMRGGQGIITTDI